MVCRGHVLDSHPASRLVKVRLAGQVVHIGTEDGLPYFFIKRYVRCGAVFERLVPVKNTTREAKLAVHRHTKHKIPPAWEFGEIDLASVRVSNHPVVTHFR